MPILILFGVIALAALIFGPQYWVRHALKTHSGDRPDLPGNGSELARHLLDEAGLQNVKVEITGSGDHYDPQDETVRLSPEHYGGRSIAAVAVAAHEVSHAVQHASGDRAFALRGALVRHLGRFDQAAMIVLFTLPLVALAVRSPALMILQVALAIALLGVRILAHLVTLPVELDASFRKALPVLERGGYLKAGDLPAVRTVLKAAAWTYVASALATLLDVARWLRILRF